MLLPFQGDIEPISNNPGRRFALPWARRSLPFQGALVFNNLYIYITNKKKRPTHKQRVVHFFSMRMNRNLFAT